MVTKDKRRPLSLANNPITDMFSVFFSENGVRGSVQRLGYDALEIDRMTGESYDEFMYPDFKSIDDEISFLEQQNKYLMAGMAASPTGLDVSTDLAATWNALKHGQPGYAVESLGDILMAGAAVGVSGKNKLLRNNQRLSELKNTKKTKKIVNKYKKPIKSQIRNTIKKDLKRGIKGAKPSQRELNRAVEHITNSTMSSQKFQKVLQNQGFMKFDDIKDVLKGSRFTRGALRKAEIKLGKQNNLTKDARKIVDKFLKNNVPFYQKGIDNLTYYKDVLKSSKYAKNFGEAWRYASPMRNKTIWAASIYGASNAYMGFKYGTEGIYDATPSGKRWDIGALPVIATYDIMESTFGGKEGNVPFHQRLADKFEKEGEVSTSDLDILNPTTVRKYFNEKKIKSYINKARNNERITNKSLIGDSFETTGAETTGAETTGAETTGVEADFDPSDFNERVLLDNPGFSSRKIDSLKSIYDKHQSLGDWDKADDLINKYPFLEDYSREKPY